MGNKIAAFIVVSIITGYFIYYYTVLVPRNIKVQDDHIVLCARILKYERAYKASDMTFSFTYKGKIFVFIKSNTPRFVVNKYNAGNNNVFIVFEKERPENWRMLADYEDFTYYNIQPKDTAGLNCNF